MNDSFGHNSRSELTSATVNGSTYGYDYDNIGNLVAYIVKTDAMSHVAINHTDDMTPYTE